ncbi:molybdopterin-guanine dinucleotide biosynthesis protein B [Helicobacter sp. MIT 14-3879]|uniref:molybdopterin-guanine dinucleotide biosynthesis protein B n=1 Tax=Helicobacter sp. MIT 14-3879 TaxID=2040649 RepID=UPI000E1FA15B|nr:molybdopterin-guanine dinucleotide biosynthesis protein B [Helicobacter sp. MIT 14-3879]RDU64775.1 molybdopterin-guanine dinucleotide biosynthesis protein B [Helicobacter sp. MIT 14-3879]
MTKIVSFSGVSNSGKTTLIEGLCKLLIPKFKVGVIKHDPKDKAVFDTIGKDSYKFFENGANVAIISPSQTTIRFQSELNNNQVLDLFNYQERLDYLFIEGFKTMPFKQICVVRNNFSEDEINSANAIATLDFNNKSLNGKTLLNLNNYCEILDWIDSQIW